MSRPIRALIDISALEDNLALVRRRAPNSRVMAVMKADAYAHGVMRVARVFRKAEGFGLLDMDDAVKLRDSGYRNTILLLEGCFSPDELAVADEFRIAIVVHNVEQIRMLAGRGGQHGLDVFLKINTGMNRLGFSPRQFAPALEALQTTPAVRSITLMTHFASADEEEGVGEQLEIFNRVTAGYRYPRTLANSAALLRYPQTHGDWVRPGIMLYGASPFAGTTGKDLGLVPVMTLKSEIISVQNLEVGARVGYGRTFRADFPMRVGTVACGYADGYPRHADTGTPVLVDGIRTRLIGRVSMDMLAVDLSPLPASGTGSPVTLWGEGLPVEEVAQATGTVSYELLCAVTQRVPVVEV